MADHKTIPVKRDTMATLREDKPDGVTWNYYIKQLRTTERVKLCGVDGCDHAARYKETGDGNALRNPRWRCADHQPNGGLWRDVGRA